MSLPRSAAVRLLLPAALIAGLVPAVPRALAHGPDCSLSWVSGPDGAMVLVLKDVTEAEAGGLKVIFRRKADGREVDLPGRRTYEASRRTLTFVPRFPLDPGVTYRGSYVIRSDGSPFELAAEFTQIQPNLKWTRLEAIYPSADVLPENQLKFYLQFSGPMSRGEAYKAVKILDAEGKPVELPFLEIGEELWDTTGSRLTLLLDPGRIKRGLKPREEDGPILEEGKSYTLAVDANWPDEAGRALWRTLKKPFKVGPPDDAQPALASWKIEAPKAGTDGPLRLRFPEPLDRAMLEHAIRVSGPDGKERPGTVKVESNETVWIFAPRAPWAVGSYTLLIDSELEDLAGNSLRRKFEIDVLRPTPRSGRDEDATRFRLPLEIH